MVEINLVGVGCNKSWKIEDMLIQLSREIGIPLQINKIMDLDSIIDLGLSTIPVIMHEGNIWTYEEIVAPGKLKQILLNLHNVDHAGST